MIQGAGHQVPVSGLGKPSLDSEGVVILYSIRTVGWLSFAHAAQQPNGPCELAKQKDHGHCNVDAGSSLPIMHLSP